MCQTINKTCPKDIKYLFVKKISYLHPQIGVITKPLQALTHFVTTLDLTQSHPGQSHKTIHEQVCWNITSKKWDLEIRAGGVLNASLELHQSAT
ncbi:hypothetical protein RSAG8_12028, partial [Rhizoctonia solani AG-8 WAC10335]